MADSNDIPPTPPQDETPTPEDAAAPTPDGDAEIAPEDAAAPTPDGDAAPEKEAAPADDAAQAALAAAKAAVNSIRDAAVSSSEDETAEPAASAPAPSNEQSPMDLPELGANGAPGDRNGLDLLSQVNLNVRIELGRTQMLVEDVLRLNEGAVVELDKLAGDPVDVYVNDRHVAIGEVLVLNESFCVRISEILAEPGTSIQKKTIPDSPKAEDETAA